MLARSLARTRLVATLLAVLAFVSVLGWSEEARAYPWMIRHDYAACSMCHADPSGAGILTPYGRAQSEVLLRTRYGADNPEEDPSKLGSFGFGALPMPEWLDAQLDARSLLLHVSPPAPAPSTTRYILMQADAATSIRAGAFRAAGSLGFAHEGALLASVTRGSGSEREDRLISRQHWIGAVFGSDDAFFLRAGRMNLPYGLRILEHTSFVRASTKTDINAAQQHGVALAYNHEGWRAELMAIAGNFQLRPDALRERGGAGYLEKAIDPTLAVGLSSLATHVDTDVEAQTSSFRQAHGLFGRYAPVKPLVLLLEVDGLVKSPKRRRIDVGGAGILQADFEPVQGLHFAATGEILTTSFARSSPSFGGWLSAYWFFLPRLDVRADVVQRSVPAGDDRVGVTTFLAQLHGWL